MGEALVVADGKKLIIGSENMGDPYYKTLPTQPPIQQFSGRNVMIDGIKAKEAWEYFKTTWESNEVGSPVQHLELTPNDLSEQARLLAKAQTEANLFPLPKQPQASYEIADSDIDFVTSQSARGRGIHLRTKQIQMIVNAHNMIMIETPYLSLDEEIINLLADKVKKNVEVIVYTNSAKSNNHPIGNPIYESMAKRLRKLGIKVYHWAGVETMHGKTIRVDDEVMISSSNMNPRSTHQDSESGLVFRSKKITQAVTNDIYTKRYRPTDRTSCFRNYWNIFLRTMLVPVSRQF